MTLVDYRDRASVLIWAILMGLVAQRLLILPERTFTGTLFGSPMSLTLTGGILLSALLAGLAATGADAVVRAHPDSLSGRVTQRWVYCTLPIALVIVAVLLLPYAPSKLYWLMGLVGTGVVLGLNMAGAYFTIDPFATGYRRARLGLNVITYAVALILFLVVYRMRARSIVSATEVLVLSSLLALELLRGSQRPVSLVAIYAGITGVILGQATWALNYLRLSNLTGGLLLLLLFYNVVGLSQHALQDRIGRRVIIEFALISTATLALIAELAPAGGS